MPINYQLIGQRVKECRCRKNLKQEGLAGDAKLSRPYLSCIETGAKRASLGSLIKIAGALDVTVDSLLLGIIPYDDADCRELLALLHDCGSTERKIIMDVALETAAALKRSMKGWFEIRV